MGSSIYPSPPNITKLADKCGAVVVSSAEFYNAYVLHKFQHTIFYCPLFSKPSTHYIQTVPFSVSDFSLSIPNIPLSILNIYFCPKIHNHVEHTCLPAITPWNISSNDSTIFFWPLGDQCCPTSKKPTLLSVLTIPILYRLI